MTALHVLFKIEDGEYVVPAADVLQMESYTGATKVPGAPAYVGGLVQIRGRVIPVIDVRARFGLPSKSPTLDSRLVVVTEADRAVGLLVDSAREVVHLAAEDLKPPPEIVSAEGEGYVRAVARSGERLLMLIDVHGIVGEERIHGE